MNFYFSNNKWTHGDGKELPSVPMQRSEPTKIPHVIAEEAYKEYAAQFGTSQSFERLNQRGGLSSSEIIILLYDRIKRILKARSVVPSAPLEDLEVTAIRAQVTAIEEDLNRGGATGHQRRFLLGQMETVLRELDKQKAHISVLEAKLARR